MEKHELSKVEFEIIDKALKALLQSNLDPVTADKATICVICCRTPTPAGSKFIKRPLNPLTGAPVSAKPRSLGHDALQIRSSKRFA